MKARIERVKKAATSPAAKAAVKSMKPEKSIWGFLGVALFFILPEIVAFIWGGAITEYAKNALSHDPGALEYYYDALVFLFEKGGSWVNLGVGIALLVWLFF